MTVKYIDQIDIKNKRVIIRVDYNVPYNSSMEITDDTRIRSTLRTINYCVKMRSKIILISHLGRPKGKIVPEMTLKPAAQRLSRIIKKEVRFFNDEIGEGLQNKIDRLNPGDICLLENIRFYPGEEKNDDDLGKKLASLADVYINDAFAAAHRGHASNDAITKFIKTSCAGFLLKDEIEFFKKALENPEKPLGAVIGGAKVSTKLNVLENILNKVDYIIIGGAMAFTFLKSKGYDTGKSLIEEDLITSAGEILHKASKKNIPVYLPVDIVAASEFKNESPAKVVPVENIPKDMIGLDIGPETINLFSEKIKNSKTVIWNGPMGAFEMPRFAEGTNELAKTIAGSRCLSIVGGGDSVTAINQLGIADKISYISTGGGAFLELLEGKKLPAIKALER